VRGKVEAARSIASIRHRPEADGRNGIKDELPPITTFLNRLLALTIELQGILFTAFEQLLTAKIEGAIAAASMTSGWRR
jgi:hypothetical protein